MAARRDILLVDGGMVDVPGPVNFHFKPGFLQARYKPAWQKQWCLLLDEVARKKYWQTGLL
jgi:hypothetical protein